MIKAVPSRMALRPLIPDCAGTMNQAVPSRPAVASKRRRRLLLLGLAVVLVALIVGSPIWFPWLLRLLLPQAGVQFTGYDRHGFGRITFADVRFTQRQASFSAEHVTLYQPVTWLWRVFQDDPDPPFLVVSNWVWRASGPAQPSQPPGDTPTRDGSPASKPGSAYDIVARIESYLRPARDWVPRASFLTGRIEIQDRVIQAPVFDWAHGEITGGITYPELSQSAQIQARLPEQQPWTIAAEIVPAGISSQLQLVRSTNALDIAGEVLWLTNRARLAARFAPGDKLPADASLEASSFRIPAEVLELKDYEQLTGSLLLEWKAGRYRADLTCVVHPVEGEAGRYPPLNALLRAQGDTNAVEVTAAEVQAPGIRAELAGPVTLILSEPWFREEARIHLSADLAEIPWFALRGNVDVEARLRPSETKLPAVVAEITASDLGYGGVQVEQAAMEARLSWPRLELTRADMMLPAGIARAAGSFDLEERILQELEVTAKGSFASFLPAYPRQDVELRATARGPIQELEHSGYVRVERLDPPATVAVDLGAEWQGRGTAVTNLAAEVRSERGGLQLSGSVALAEKGGFAHVNSLDLIDSGAPVLRLDRPVQIRWSVIPAAPAGAGTGAFEAAVSPMRWTGPGGDLALEARISSVSESHFSLSARDLGSDLLAPFLERPLPEIEIVSAELSSRWTNGPASLDLQAAARYTPENRDPLAVAVELSGDPGGIDIESLALSRAGQAVLEGSGFVPVLVQPVPERPLVEIQAGNPIGLRVSTHPNNPFWSDLAEMTGVRLEDPMLDLAISGSLKAPQGHLLFGAERIRLDRLPQKSSGTNLPAVTRVRLDLDLNRDKALLKRLDFLVEGQTVSLSGELPFAEDLSAPWKEFLQWERATGRLRIPRADVAPFARFLPEYISPQGRLQANIAVNPGLNLFGALTLSGAATRPLLPVGPIHDIYARIDFEEKMIRIQSLSGLVGGEQVRVSGEVDLARKKAATGLPLVNLELRGTNVPLVRRTDLVLRSDLALGISNATNDQAVVSGEVNLRNSLFLSDLRALIPGKLARPKLRPPYFSIEADPVDDWLLAVTVRGDRFLQVRSPLFRGEVSALLKLEGTLEEPLATGDVTINSGTIQFPFANLRVNQGLISVSSDNPYQPQLFVTASSRAFGYEVRMEVTGTADTPIVEFTSTPGLSSEQIVLMLTAGEMPRDDFNFSTSQRATRLGLFLGRNLLSKFGGGEGMGDRLVIRSGEQISEEGKQTYSVEYKLNEDWSLVGEYDRFNEFNAGIKWRFYSR